MAKVELVHKRRVVNQTRARRKVLNKTEKDSARVELQVTLVLHVVHPDSFADCTKRTSFEVNWWSRF